MSNIPLDSIIQSLYSDKNSNSTNCVTLGIGANCCCYRHIEDTLNINDLKRVISADAYIKNVKELPMSNCTVLFAEYEFVVKYLDLEKKLKTKSSTGYTVFFDLPIRKNNFIAEIVEPIEVKQLGNIIRLSGKTAVCF